VAQLLEEVSSKGVTRRDDLELELT
jgi:hypothetical protein